MKIESSDISTVKKALGCLDEAVLPAVRRGLDTGALGHPFGSVPVFVDESIPKSQVRVRDDDDDVVALIVEAPLAPGTWFWMKVPKDPLSQGLFARRVRGETEQATQEEPHEEEDPVRPDGRGHRRRLSRLLRKFGER